MITIAKLGGYLNRKCDGPLGFESLWKGYARFHDMVYICMLKEAAEMARNGPTRRSGIPGQAQT
ncbi:MAG: hypothetical protein O2960_17580 [Verrucomicrobia bacterium]|nr:hypothetical protein [Verrucomicrobiota bacterium]